MSPNQSTKPITTISILVACSIMISIGTIAFLTKKNQQQVSSEPQSQSDEQDQTPPQAVLDTSSMISTAESYLDAWRKRDYETALAISIEQAHIEAQARAQRAEEFDLQTKALEQRIWPELAASRLRFEAEKTTERDPLRNYLEGRALGTFLDQPYVRRVAFEVVKTPEGFRIARMDLGTIEQGAEINSGSP